MSTRSTQPKPKFKYGDRVCDLDGGRPGVISFIGSWVPGWNAYRSAPGGSGVFAHSGHDIEGSPGYYTYKVQQDDGPRHTRNEPNLRRCTAAENRAAKARKNPGIGDYASAGRRAAARVGAAVAGQARILAEQARQAAALEAERRRPGEPTVKQAITVLARAHGVKVNPALIRHAAEMTPGMARYWNKVAATKAVDVVDPWRADLKSLRAEYPKGTKVYRASTGGRWGKSAGTRVLNPKKPDANALLKRLDDLGFPSLVEDIRTGDVRLSDALRDLAYNEQFYDDNPKPSVYKRAREIVHLLLAPGTGLLVNGVRSNPRDVVSDDKAIAAFLAKRPAKSRQLSSTGTELSLHWPRAVVAEWVGEKIKLGIAYGNVSQSYIKKVARAAPAYLLTADSYWALPAKTVKLLKREGRGNPRALQANPRKLLGWNTPQGKVTRGYFLVDPPSGRSPWWTITRHSDKFGTTYFTVERDGQDVGSRGTLGLAKDLAERDAELLLRGVK